jgi:hypothetical protein
VIVAISERPTLITKGARVPRIESDCLHQSLYSIRVFQPSRLLSKNKSRHFGQTSQPAPSAGLLNFNSLRQQQVNQRPIKHMPATFQRGKNDLHLKQKTVQNGPSCQGHTAISGPVLLVQSRRHNTTGPTKGNIQKNN